MKSQEELRADYRDAIAKVWSDQKMRDYCDKTAVHFVELADGDFMSIDKPRIETRFCFGYGYCGVSSEEEYRDAAAMSRHAETSEEYFKKENLKELNDWIAHLGDSSIKAYKRPSYGRDGNSHLKSIALCRYWESPGYAGAVEMTEDERRAIIAGYEEVKKGFEKRLNTYLKRYGLSKVRSWTYLSD